ncbi:MAG: sugar phosphorylase, partial [Anaerolineae bacterium]|nr:sugar phosphorylase [Anaerolineae bacterium]
TFSADQVDLNFANPDVLLEVANILLFYAAHGAEFIRLDAVTFVWKEIGTTCINSPHTHRIVQTMRTVLDMVAPELDMVAPDVVIITETNVPHKDNIAYFGDGTNEAQMVYNFALPILTLHAFHNEDVITLSDWAATLDLPSNQTTFFNFLAGHDGIGMLPVKNILSLDDLNKLAARTQALGGHVSYKSNGDGSQSPYELNINYLDALNNPDSSEQSTELIAKRFLATQAIMLALRGVPGIYFNSIFGSRNWTEGVEQTGRHRTINREKVQRAQIEAELNDPTSLRYHVFSGYKKLLKARMGNPAFHPYGAQEILSVHPSVFALLRTSLNGETRTLCLNNVSHQTQEVTVNLADFSSLTDILSKKEYSVIDNQLKIKIAPYEVIWLTN